MKGGEKKRERTWVKETSGRKCKQYEKVGVYFLGGHQRNIKAKETGSKWSKREEA